MFEKFFGRYSVRGGSGWTAHTKANISPGHYSTTDVIKGLAAPVRAQLEAITVSEMALYDVGLEMHFRTCKRLLGVRGKCQVQHPY